MKSLRLLKLAALALAGGIVPAGGLMAQSLAPATAAQPAPTDSAEALRSAAVCVGSAAAAAAAAAATMCGCRCAVVPAEPSGPRYPRQAIRHSRSSTEYMMELLHHRMDREIIQRRQLPPTPFLGPDR